MNRSLRVKPGEADICFKSDKKTIALSGENTFSYRTPPVAASVDIA